MMVYRILKTVIQVGLSGAVTVLAQNTCGNTKLECLLPTALHTNTPTFNFFNQTFATQIGQLPLATPASGFIFTFDKQKGVYTAAQESFGPLAAERAETIGYHKVYLAFTYQRFAFDELYGNNLGKLPLVFLYPSPQSPQVVTTTSNRIDTKVNQYVGFLTYGISRSLDISIAVPFSRIALGVSTVGTEYSTTTPANVPFKQTLAGSASGIGDVVLAGKGTLYKGDKYGVAAGMELRLPSGDEKNFLGSGAIGLKPYVALARRGRIAPHLNLIYQWNSNSSLNTNANGAQQSLPQFFGYTFGADISLLKRATFAADLVGQHFFDAPGITSANEHSYPVNNGSMPFPTVQQISDDYDVENLALGLKINPWNKLLLLGNATIKLNDGGLRATVVPLVGISYSF
jgi:hypothetical protein